MKNENFEISVSCYDKKVTVNRDYPDVTIYVAVEDVVTCLLGLSFSKEQIIKGFSEYINEEQNEIS